MPITVQIKKGVKEKQNLQVIWMRKESSRIKKKKNPNLFNVPVVTCSPHSPFPSITACAPLYLVYQIITELLEGCDPVLLTWNTDFHIIGTQHTSLMLTRHQRGSGQRSKAWFHLHFLWNSVQPHVLWKVKCTAKLGISDEQTQKI